MTIFVKSGGSDANGGTGFAAGSSKATLTGGDAIDVPGDLILLSPTHTETTAATLSYTFAGTIANPTKVLSVDSDATDSPTGTAAPGVTGAQINTTGAFHLRIAGNAYFEGIKFSCGNASNAGILSLNYAGSCKQKYKNCDLFESDSHPSAFLAIGPVLSGTSADTEIEDCRLKISNATQYFGIGSRVRISGGSTAAGIVSPTAGLFNGVNTAIYSDLLVEDFDMSNLAVGFNLVGAPAASGAQKQGIFRFHRVKLPVGWSGSPITSLATLVNPNFRVELYNKNLMWTMDCYGATKSETVIVKTGSTSAISWKLDTTANASEFGGTLKSGGFGEWNLNVGTAISAEVDFVHDSLTALTNADLWLEVHHLGTSGSDLGMRATSQRASPLAAAVAHAASAAVWTTTGMTNPNKQKLAIAFTPQEAGLYELRLCCGKPSSGSIYTDPVVQEV